MSSSPDNHERDALEKLLRLKRHEQPPPRYFKEFSGRVLGRIERGEGRPSWWERFGFDLRPALAAGAGLLACGLIIYGVATTDGDAGAADAGSPLGLTAKAAPSVPLLTDAERSVAANSTNPAPYGTPIDQAVFRAQVIPASYQPR